MFSRGRAASQHRGKQVHVAFYVTVYGTSVLGLDTIQRLGLQIDGATLTCRFATPLSSQLRAGVPPGSEHLSGRALRRVTDYVHRIKRRQDIVLASAKLRGLRLALRQVVASERGLESEDITAMSLPFSATVHLLKHSFNGLQPRIFTWDLGRRVLGILPPRCQRPIGVLLQVGTRAEKPLKIQEQSQVEITLPVNVQGTSKPRRRCIVQVREVRRSRQDYLVGRLAHRYDPGHVVTLPPKLSLPLDDRSRRADAGCLSLPVPRWSWRADAGFEPAVDPLFQEGWRGLPRRTVRAQGHNSLPPEPVCRRLRRRTAGVQRGDPASSDFVTAGDGAATTSSPLKGADGEATTAQANTPTT
ncbi:hypothetical protein HPB52_003226 [Rhipicephalus sanguineus]|uniref:Uncharacterized protein n=1 Tax=Rhipicephalus sanguineus TaxID=34632 RepID=A0A9D4PQN0_RHISA|nr:hypothetical protein HPB52_003226 [Rhipicephalus sanguineus]